MRSHSIRIAVAILGAVVATLVPRAAVSEQADQGDRALRHRSGDRCHVPRLSRADARQLESADGRRESPRRRRQHRRSGSGPVSAGRVHRALHRQRDARRQPVPLRQHGLRSGKGSAAGQHRCGHRLRAPRGQQPQGQIGRGDRGDGQGRTEAVDDGRGEHDRARAVRDVLGCDQGRRWCAFRTRRAIVPCSPTSCAATSISSSRRCRRRWRRSTTGRSRRSPSRIRRARRSFRTCPRSRRAASTSSSSAGTRSTCRAARRPTSCRR